MTLVDSANGQKITVTSKAGGDYQLLQIPPAKYTINVTAVGFGDQSKVATLLVNQPATVNFTLGLQSSVEVVNVTAAAQTLSKTVPIDSLP